MMYFMQRRQVQTGQVSVPATSYSAREMSNSNIPSEDEFARAKAAMRYRNRGLSNVRERVLERFRARGVHEFFIFYSRATNTFGAYVFYSSERDIVEAEESGLSAVIREAVYEELTAAGREERDTLDLVVEFDSHENVERNYEGDYFLRLR